MTRRTTTAAGLLVLAALGAASAGRLGGRTTLRLAYTYFLGGSGDDELWWFRQPVAGGDGTLYLAGCTKSADFPVTPDALFGKYGGGNRWGREDSFLVRFDTRRQRVEYATFLGGASGPEFISDVRLGRRQRIYIAGNTGAPDFPTTSNAYSRRFGGPDFRHADGFFTILGAGGRTLEYSSFVGGSGNDQVQQVFEDESGNFTLFGITETPGYPSPDTPRAPGLREGPALFRFTLDPSGQHLVDSRLIGNSWSFDVEKLRRGGFVVVGTTNNPDFPITAGAWDRSYNGGAEQFGGDLFALWMTPSGEITASTFFGGSGEEGSSPKIAVVGEDDIVIVSRTQSKDLPVTADALAKTPSGSNAAYLARLDRRGARLAYSTYLPGEVLPRAMAYDGHSRVYIAGVTSSATLPVTRGALQATHKGGSDAFILVFNLLEKRIEYYSYLGGTKEDAAFGLALDPGGAVYVVGTTNSDDFPAGGARQSVRRGLDIFISKLIPAE